MVEKQDWFCTKPSVIGHFLCVKQTKPFGLVQNTCVEYYKPNGFVTSTHDMNTKQK